MIVSEELDRYSLHRIAKSTPGGLFFFLSDVWNRYMFLSRRDMNENLMFRFFFSSFYVDTCVVTTPDA